MLEALFEAIFEIVGELLLQLIWQGLGEMFRVLLAPGLRKKIGRPGAGRTPQREVLHALLYGVVCAAGTLYFFPQLAIRNHQLQLINLAAAPVIAGLSVERLRALRGEHQGFRIDTFAYAALFALVFAGMRFAFAR